MMFGTSKPAEPGNDAYGDSYGGSGGGAAMFANEGPGLEEYKEAAAKVASRVGEKASKMKEQAADWFS